MPSARALLRAPRAAALAAAALRSGARALPALGAALLLAPAAAHAQPAAPRAQPADAYRAHMENGGKLYADGSFEAALAEFRAAYDARPKASPLINVALCYKSLRNYPRAIEALQTALDRHSDSMSPADRKAAEDAIAEMRGLLAHVRLSIMPPGAALTIDGEGPPPAAPDGTIPLGPGKHTLVTRAEGFADLAHEIVIASGETAMVVLRMTPDKGYLTVEAGDPRAVIAIDSQEAGKGAWKGFVAPGTHMVQIYRPGSPTPYAVEVLVAAGKAQDIRPGYGGIPVSPPSREVPATAPRIPPPPQPKKEEPPRRGLFALADASLLWPTTHPTGFSHGSNSGGAGGLRVGYRVNTPAAFDLHFQYANMFTPQTSAGVGGSTPGYTWASTRIGLDLRLMTPGRTARFIGGFGGGVAYDKVTFDAGATCDSLPFGASNPTPIACRDARGVSPFVVGEVGFELDFGGVLVDLAFESHFESSRGISAADGSGEIYGHDSLFDLGGGLRIGYGAW